jgi:hypothetical protein
MLVDKKFFKECLVDVIVYGMLLIVLVGGTFMALDMLDKMP